MTTAIGFFAPQATSVQNSIDAWFAGGGLGVYYHADPAYCFTDVAATTHAAVGDSVARINDRAGSAFYLRGATTATSPILRWDATRSRHYLEFTAASAMRLSADLSSVASDWTWLHNGTEVQSVALAQYGNSSNPNALYALWATNQGSSSQTGASAFFDDRASVPHNNAQRHMVTKGNGSAIDLAVDNAITPNTPQVISQSYLFGATGNDCVMRVASSVTGGAETVGTPQSGTPTGRLTLGAFINATAPLEGRIYAQALLRGPGARTNIASYEADI